MTPKTPPLSPFRWKEDPRPSIFATDPYFKSRRKAGLLDSDEGLKYKQFGEYSRAVAAKTPYSKGDTDE